MESEDELIINRATQTPEIVAISAASFIEGGRTGSNKAGRNNHPIHAPPQMAINVKIIIGVVI